MHDIEALKHDKLSAAVKFVGVLQGMVNGGDLPPYLEDAIRKILLEYMTAEDALSVALDERQADWEAREKAQ